MQSDFLRPSYDLLRSVEDRNGPRLMSLSDSDQLEMAQIASDDITRPLAGPSRLRRTRSDLRHRTRHRSNNPDRHESHWLSEDEGTDAAEAQLVTRRADSDDDGRGDRDEDGDDLFEHPDRDDLLGGKMSLPSSLANGHYHKLHHRPAKVPDPGDLSTAPLPVTASLLSIMQRALECPACRDVMINPTTLACGHSVCFSCNSLTTSRSVPTTPAPLPSISPMQRGHSTSSGRPGRSASLTSSILPNWLSLSRWASTHDGDSASSSSSQEGAPTAGIFGRASGSPKATSSDPPPYRPSCPHAACRDVAKTGPLPHVDVVLQKLVVRFIQEAPDKAPLSERFRMLSTRPLPKSKRTISDEKFNHATAADDELQRRHSSGNLSSATIETTSSGSVYQFDNGKRVKLDKDGAVKRMRLPSFTKMVSEDAMEEDDISSAELPPTRVSTFASDILSELECQVCASTIVTPMTTPCGHTFCRRCLMRSLDHSDRCPLCRDDLPPYAFFANHAANGPLLLVLESTKGFKAITEERIAQQAGESTVSLRAAPVFVCSLSFPKLPTFLHVFEPRYRLMMRRAMETDRRFGMLLPQRSGRQGLYEYGTMLEIRNIQMLPDGRSVVETVGIYRFKVLENSMRDGYNTAAIERIDDIPPEEEVELEKAELARLLAQPAPMPHDGLSADDLLRLQIDRLSTEELMSLCGETFERLRTGSIGAPWLYQRLNNTFGPMPDNAADASYWLASVLPIDDYQKAQLLPITSPRLRLRLVVYWIEQMRGKWWFGQGSCSIM